MKTLSRTLGLAERSESESETDAESAASDTGSFEDLFRQHEPFLRRRATNLVGNRADADDLVQDTLKRALIHFQSFRQGTSWRAWLVTIMTRLYLDQDKHEKVVRGAEADLVTLKPVNSHMELITIPDDQLWDAVGELDPELNQVIELRFNHGLKCREIAARLDLPMGTVGRRLSDAYDWLLRRLTRQDRQSAVPRRAKRRARRSLK